MRISILAAVAAGALICAGASSSSAAPASALPQVTASSQSTIAEPAQFRSRCRRWSRECRIRWGWGPRFRRCMVRHGC